MTNAITLGTSAIREFDGLYSLNDLHVASGGEARHRPGYFTSNDQTKALIVELQTAGIPAVKTKEGCNGGTYACHELVIAYAAWISAAFHLKVIQVFLAQLHAPTSATIPETNNSFAGLKMAENYVKHNRFLLSFDQKGLMQLREVPKGAHVRTTTEFIQDILGDADLTITPKELGEIVAAVTDRLIGQTQMQTQTDRCTQPTNAPMPTTSSDLRWRNHDEVKTFFRSIRLRHDAMFQPTLITPEQARQMLKDRPCVKRQLEKYIATTA